MIPTINAYMITMKVLFFLEYPSLSTKLDTIASITDTEDVIAAKDTMIKKTAPIIPPTAPIASIITTKTGINILLYLSIPFSTPLYTINAVMPKYISIQIIGSGKLVIYPVKNPSCTACSPFPVRYTNRYLNTQPPIEQ